MTPPHLVENYSRACPFVVLAERERPHNTHHLGVHAHAVCLEPCVPEHRHRLCRVACFLRVRYLVQRVPRCPADRWLRAQLLLVVR